MKKERAEVLKHLENTGYSRHAMNKIAGFLIGAGLKDVDEAIVIAHGKGTFDDFYDWYVGSDFVTDWVAELAMHQAKSSNDAEKALIDKRIDYLVNSALLNIIMNGDDEQ